MQYKTWNGASAIVIKDHRVLMVRTKIRKVGAFLQVG